MFDENLMRIEGMRPVMGALSVLALLQAAFVIGQACFLSQAISLLWHGESLEEAVALGAAFLACFAANALTRFSKECLLDRFSRDAVSQMKRRIVDDSLDPDVMLGRVAGTTEVATAATDGVDEVETYLRLVPDKLASLAVVTTAVLVCEFAIDWPSGVILLVAFPVIMFFMVLLGRQARAHSERQYDAYLRLSNRFMDTLGGMRTIIALGATKREARGVYESSERLRKATMRTLSVATLSSAVLDFCATFGVAAVAMMLAFRLMDGSAALSTALFALILAPEFFAAIRSFAGDYHASLDGKCALEKLLDLASRADELKEGRPRTPGEISWGPSSTIEFSDVSFAYPGTDRGIGNVTFRARMGQRIAIVGTSGSGKTTLANLIAGLARPDLGSIAIDGVPVDLTSPEWRRIVRSVPQSPYLFSATLDENLRLYRPDATRSEVMAAVRAVGLGELVESLDDGLDTLVGAGARGLSGGEAHRVALARILLDDKARILVFDEPTAHLDLETELELKEPMLKLMEGRLAFFATHRLHWLDNLDRALRLEDGKLVGASDNATVKDAVLRHQPHVAPARSAASPPPAESREPDVARRAWLGSHLRSHRKDIVSALALGVATAACASLLMFTSGYLISAAALESTTLFSVMVPVAFVQLFGFGRPLARYAERLASHNWVLKLTSDLRLALFRGIERTSGEPGGQKGVGEYLTLLQDDVAHLQNLYLRVVFPTVVTYLAALGASVLFGLFSWALAGTAAAVFALCGVALPGLARMTTRGLIIRLGQARHHANAALADDILGAPDWIASGRQGEAAESVARDDAQVRTLAGRIRLRRRAFSLVSTLLLGAFACALLIWSGAALSTSGGNANWIAALVLGFFPLIDGFAELPAAFSSADEHAEALARLDAYIPKGTPSPAADKTPSADPKPQPEKTLSRAADTAVRASGLSFAYPRSKTLALEDVNLSLPARTATAILGRSGAGKSTFASLACGVFPSTQGDIRVCGELPGPQSISYLGQTPYLFNRTLRENLLIGNTSKTDAELVALLAQVGLEEAFEALPSGLDTLIGQGGRGFSGGEAHRLALARVLACDTAVVLIDEPFSALDPRTERRLLDVLLDTCASRTLVVITHHLAEIARFDRVVFIESGRIDMDASPQDLIAHNLRFKELYDLDR